MKIKLALVKYVSDKKRDVVGVDDIINFKPKSVNDFDPRKSYDVQCSVVRRSASDLHDEHFKQPYKAKIILLAANDQSLLSQARKYKESLPAGYSDRVKKESKEQATVEAEQPKTTKECKKAMNKANEERLREIINMNLQDSVKNKENNSAVTQAVEMIDCEKTEKPENDERESVPGSPVKLVTSSEGTNSPEKKEPAFKSVSMIKESEATKPEEKNANCDNSLENGDIFTVATNSEEKGKSSHSLSDGSLNSPGKLSASFMSETESDTDCSYESSDGEKKEMEGKLVSLQLEAQSLRQKNSVLSKCLSSHLQLLNQQSEYISDILILHGDKSSTVDTGTKSTNEWVVGPSPCKQTGPQKTLSPVKSTTQSFMVGSPGISPRKTTPVKVLQATPSKIPETKDSPSKKITPIKPVTKSEDSAKCSKKNKVDNPLKSGEVKAEVISIDLLKVLKEEREIPMNEEKSKVCIGNNTGLKKGVWKDKFFKSTSDIKKLVSDVALEIWGLEGCAKLSLTGGKSPKNPDAPQKQPAPAGKVEAIFGLCRAHLILQGMTNPSHLEQSMKLCREYLRVRFNEAARTAKRDKAKASNKV